MAVTILAVAEHRLGREPSTGADFAAAGVAIMGGCQHCGASLAAYNGYPSKSGYWRCASCIGDDGWTDVGEACGAIFGPPSRRCVVLGGPGGYLTVLPVDSPLIADRYRRWQRLFTFNRPLTPALADAAKGAALRCFELA